MWYSIDGHIDNTRSLELFVKTLSVELKKNANSNAEILFLGFEELTCFD